MSQQAIFYLDLHNTTLTVEAVLPAGQKTLELPQNAVPEEADDDFQAAPAPDGPFTVYTFAADRPHRFRYRCVLATGDLFGVSDHKILLNGYAGCFPRRLSACVEETRCVLRQGFDGFDLIDGHHDADGRRYKCQLWTPDAPECANLICLRRGCYHSVSAGGFTAYCTRSASIPCITDMISYAAGCLDYDTRLFGARPAPHVSLLLLDEGEWDDSYARPGLIVLCGDGSEESYCSALGHELGRRWACGAATDSFEDWLNETGARWLSNLMLLHAGKGELLEQEKARLFAAYQQQPGPIRTPDGSRPANVPLAGTVLLWQVYQRYGMKTVIALLRKFFDLKEKTTENWLAAVRQDKACAFVADLLENALVKPDLLAL